MTKGESGKLGWRAIRIVRRLGWGKAHRQECLCHERQKRIPRSADFARNDISECRVSLFAWKVDVEEPTEGWLRMRHECGRCGRGTE